MALLVTWRLCANLATPFATNARKGDTWQEYVGVRIRPNPKPFPEEQINETQIYQPVRQVDEPESETDSEDSLAILTVERKKDRLPPIQVCIGVDNCSVTMEVDTGASVSIMSEAVYHKLWPGRSLSTSPIRLQTYSKELIAVVGGTEVQWSMKVGRLREKGPPSWQETG